MAKRRPLPTVHFRVWVAGKAYAGCRKRNLDGRHPTSTPEPKKVTCAACLALLAAQTDKQAA